ncbi:hypothetical protein O3P69_008879 [Scylla paramamosain]|uniref:Uncharacterized protein n=1 Tax=Scylla paramamosain TaxID=85552 RepID=A0AAW0TT28_SCYPA
MEREGSEEERSERNHGRLQVTKENVRVDERPKQTCDTRATRYGTSGPSRLCQELQARRAGRIASKGRSEALELFAALKIRALVLKFGQAGWPVMWLGRGSEIPRGSGSFRLDEIPLRSSSSRLEKVRVEGSRVYQGEGGTLVVAGKPHHPILPPSPTAVTPFSCS